MARIYYGSFLSIQNIEYKVEIWDGPSGSPTAGTELKLAGNGFSLEIQGQGNALYESPIKPSRVNSQWVMPNQTVLNNFISLSTNLENYWALIVYRAGEPIFIGRIVADQMTRLRESIDSKPIIDLVAVDGLELLDAYNVDESWFTDGKITATYLIRKSLENLELYDYWVSLGINNFYFYDAVSIYSSEALRKGLDLLYLDINTFLPEFDAFQDIKAMDASSNFYEPLNMINCKTAIEQLATNLGAQFVMDKGSYWMYSANNFTNSTVPFRRYSYTMQYLGASTYSHRQTIGNDVRPLWEAKPTLFYQPSIQKLIVNQKRQMAAKIIRAFDDQAVGALQLVAPSIPTGTNPNDAPMRIRVVSKSEIYRASGTMKEDRTYMNVIVWIENSSGAKMQADGSGYWFSVAVAVGDLVEKITFDNKSTWVDMVFEKSLTTAPVGFDKLYIKIDYVKASVMTYTALRGWRSSALANKDFWGSIQVGFADTSNYQNPDFVYNLAEVFLPSASSTINSNMVELQAAYYTAPNRYSIGNILVNDGTSNVLATDWFGGFDSVTHGTLTAMLGKTFAGIYANFLPVIQGNWIDTGTYSPIKTLYFDNATWVLNGCKYDARAEQWDGEWLAIAPVYTNTTSTGEGQRINKDREGVTLDRINYHEQAVANLQGYIQNVPNQMLEELINNADGAPTAQPSLNTRWEVMLQYVHSSTEVEWHVQEHNASVTYTNGTHTITNGYELIIGNSTDGNVTINLPNADLSKGKKYYFIKTATAHVVTISGGTFNINGSTTTTINNLYGSKTIISNGVQWYIIASV